MHVTDRKKCTKCARYRGVSHMGDMPPPPPPPGKTLISDLPRLLLVPFWDETARVGQPTANLVIVLEAQLNARTI